MKIFIGFDQKKGNIRILKTDKGAEPVSFTLKYQSMLFSEDFFNEFLLLLSDFVKSNAIPNNTLAYLVMPNNTVSFETFDLPYMNKSKTLKALETELINEYGAEFLKDKKINKFVISTSRQYTTYGVTFYDKKLSVQLYKIIREAKLLPRGGAYNGANLVTSVMHYMRSHGKNFLVADIRDDRTELALCNKGKTMGVASLLYGLNVINNPEVCDEYMLSEHTVAEIAVINAREIARAKALTTTGNETEDEALPETVVADSQEAAAAGQEVAATADNPEDDEDFEEEDVAEESAPAGETVVVADESQAAALPKAQKVKIYKKARRRLPKFMQREIPTEPQQITYENFRIILKWLLLYARQSHLSTYLAEPDFIIVNLPENLHYLLDMANEEQGEGSVELRPLKGSDKRSQEVLCNLDLLGASFTTSLFSMFKRNNDM